jgi:hypothetical protein
MKLPFGRTTRRAIGRVMQAAAMNGAGHAPTFLRAVRGMPAFVRDATVYWRSHDGGKFPLRVASLLPALADRYDSAGATGHYFHQDLWAASRIHARRPSDHVDIGSRIDGFVAHLLVFMPVTVVDIRPLKSDIARLSFIQDDATSLRSFADDSVDSLSSLHAVEHFGLGRYGDPVDPGASFRMMRGLARVLKPGGRLYFSVPVGRERLEFNAHRVFSPHTVIDAVAPLRLVSFAAVDDAGNLRDPSSPAAFETANYACGLYEFTKD